MQISTRDFAQAIIEALRGAILVLDRRLRARFASRAFYEIFQIHPQEADGQLVYALGNGEWNIPPLRTLIEQVAASSEMLRDVRVDSEFPQIGRKVLLINARRINRGDGDSQAP